MVYPTSYANLTDFLYFIRNEMGIPVAALPDNSVDIIVAFEVAKATVSKWFTVHSKIYYNLAVYNFGGDYLINWASDQTCGTYFADLRKTWKITSFVAGVVQSTADESTSMSLLVPDVMQGLSLADLQELKTPYGRAYLAIAQKMGSVWGIS